MTAIRYKRHDGVWGDIAPGNIYSRWGGGWFPPTYVRAKYTKPDGTPAWTDTGYIGYPAAPSAPGVYGWDFNNVALYWSAGSGGAAVQSYELLQQDSNGNNLRLVTGVGGSPWGNFGVVEDGYYKFWVRSKSYGGTYSAWAGPLRVRIGHTEQGYYANENRTRYWGSSVASGARRNGMNGTSANGVAFAAYVPGNVVIQTMHWRNLRTPQGNIIAPAWNEWGPMTIRWAYNGMVQNPITDFFGDIWSGDNRDWGGLDRYGNGSWWGLVPDGTGWSSWDDPQHMLYADAVWVDGYEVYQVQVYYITRNRQENGYW